MQKFKHLGLSALLLLLSIGGMCQDSFKVMSYNVLNYPTGDMPSREDTLGVIIDFVEPDLILLQELKTNGGLQSIAAECNEHLEGSFVTGTWQIQQSNPASTWKLQQNVVYNTERFILTDEYLVLTPIRDINAFVFELKDENWANGGSGAEFYAFVTHLKSSQGAENEASRAASAAIFAEHLSTLPSAAQVILGGDFNVYDSSEEGYQILLDENNAIQMVDPIDSPGNWHSSSFPDKEILTQSTRTSQIYGDGAGGGLDDRFDFILMSENLQSSNEAIVYEEGSYTALGNNGTCYNDRILDCEGAGSLPFYMLSALYYSSDHLPVIMDFEVQTPFSIAERTADVSILMAGSQLFNKSGQQATVYVYAMNGALLLTDQLGASSSLDIERANLPEAVYLIQVVLESGLAKNFKWFGRGLR